MAKLWIPVVVLAAGWLSGCSDQTPPGKDAPIGLEPNAYGGIRLSPDARRVAVELLNDIWIYDFASGTLSRATYRGVNEFPVWSPDGRHIAISSSQGVPLPALFSIAFDGGEPALRIAHEAGLVQFPGSWTPDGRRRVWTSKLASISLA